jgi:hypothetical protein
VCLLQDAELFRYDDASLAAHHIARLHVQLREYCDLMGVGLTSSWKSKDSVVEDGSSGGKKVGGGDGEGLQISRSKTTNRYYSCVML